MKHIRTWAYTSLPHYLKRDAAELASRKFGLGLTDMMKGAIRFEVGPVDPETRRRRVTGFVLVWDGCLSFPTLTTTSDEE